jgi:hypothetical protein
VGIDELTDVPAVLDRDGTEGEARLSVLGAAIGARPIHSIEYE